MGGSAPLEPTDPTPPGHAAFLRAGSHAPSVAVFVITWLAILAADLGIKAWSFATVAGRPVVLDRQAARDPWFWDQYAHEPTVLIPGLLNLHLTTNTGAVFGLGKGAQTFFVVVSIVAVAVLWRVFWRSPARAYVMHAALGLILGGALGNLHDRLRFNAVRDMFHMLPDTRLWPWIFNLADAALMIGVGLLMVILWISDRRGRTAGSDPD